jgi:hypothetical protein
MEDTDIEQKILPTEWHELSGARFPRHRYDDLPAWLRPVELSGRSSYDYALSILASAIRRDDYDASENAAHSVVGLVHRYSDIPAIRRWPRGRCEIGMILVAGHLAALHIQHQLDAKDHWLTDDVATLIEGMWSPPARTWPFPNANANRRTAGTMQRGIRDFGASTVDLPAGLKWLIKLGVADQSTWPNVLRHMLSDTMHAYRPDRTALPQLLDFLASGVMASEGAQLNEFVEAVQAGATYQDALSAHALSANAVNGRRRTDPEFAARLDDALMQGRAPQSAGYQHGTIGAYRHGGCRCPECREARRTKRLRPPLESGGRTLKGPMKNRRAVSGLDMVPNPQRAITHHTTTQ